MEIPQSKPESIRAIVDVTAEREFNAEQITESARSGGYVINGDRLRILRDFGASAEQLGPLRLMKGGIVVSLDALMQAITAATKIVMDESGDYKTKDKIEAGKLIGYLANATSKVTSGAVGMDRAVAEVVMEADSRRRQSFGPGQVITKNP